MLRRYQDVLYDLHRHVVELTKAGEFTGRHAARTVMIHFAMNVSNKEDAANGLHVGYVMEGCISQPVIARSTGLDKATVSRSLVWLHEQGFIRVRREYEGKRQHIASVAITSRDAASESERKAWLLQGGMPVPQPAKTKRKLRLVVNE